MVYHGKKKRLVDKGCKQNPRRVCTSINESFLLFFFACALYVVLCALCYADYQARVFKLSKCFELFEVCVRMLCLGLRLECNVFHVERLK